jgi:hypothetical protein
MLKSMIWSLIHLLSRIFSLMVRIISNDWAGPTQALQRHITLVPTAGQTQEFFVTYIVFFLAGGADDLEVIILILQDRRHRREKKKPRTEEEKPGLKRFPKGSKKGS